MEIKSVDYNLVFYLALIEGISLFILDILNAIELNIIYMWFFIGFIPALIALVLYRLISSHYPIKINKKAITKFPILLPSIANGLLIIILFLIQAYVLLKINGHMLVPVFGFFSVFFTFLIMVFVYNKLNIKYKSKNLLKIRFHLGNKKIELKKMSLFFAFYAGIFEFFILPLMALFTLAHAHPFLNGLASGFIGSAVALFIVNKIIEKRPLEIN